MAHLDHDQLDHLTSSSHEQDQSTIISAQEQEELAALFSPLLSPEQTEQLRLPNIDRKNFLTILLTMLSALIMAQLGPLAPRAKAASSGAKEAAEHLSHDSLSLAALDGFGTLAFADSMNAIAQGRDSYVQKLAVALGLPTYNTGHLDHSNGKHQLKFPLENVHLAAIMNIIRSTAFGPEVRKHTIHEFETTMMGLGLLLGLTSVARGIVTTGHVLEESESDTEHTDPEEVLADSIFQLTVISAATQLPLSSFGNATIGNQKFKEVHWAFDKLYKALLPQQAETMSLEEITTHVRLAATSCENPVIKKNVLALLEKGTFTSVEELHAQLEEKIIAHKHDLMTILMATSCDDAQAAAGDPGPLVGLWQKFGNDFLHAVPSLIPYTVLIGFERTLFAANRAGIKNPVVTEERMAYMKEFLANTWKNLIAYFVTAAPRISSSIAGTGKERTYAEGEAGVDFSLLEQILRDVEAGISTAFDAVAGSINEDALDEKKVRNAIRDLQIAKKDWNAVVGDIIAKRIFPEQQEEGSISKQEVIDIQQEITGAKSSDKQLQALQIEMAKLAAIPEDEDITKFVSLVQELRDTHFVELERAIYEAFQEQGAKPTISSIADVVAKNPKLRDLLDINYWHDRIGPALTDTLFVVLLQGLHLPFLINTSERIMYNALWFKNLPLASQEILSVLYNNGIGMFADNWADCVAHSNWMTTIYFNKLQADTEALISKYDDVQTPHFRDDTTALIPKRFEQRAEQIIVFANQLKQQHAEDSKDIDAFTKQALEDVKKYYFKAMLIAMTISVVGAGKSLPGDSTHFTFAAGETDFTLAVTLEDFKRHPLYHVWELIFSGTYATIVGPLIAQHAVAPAFAKLNIGYGLTGKIDAMMKEQFHATYPGFEEHLKKLQQQA